ncbi:MAG: SDR family NAD(P)-dependent oxidoreductase [Flexilinea sp.]
MFNPLDLTDKKIFVTGASSGLGKVAAIYFSRLGAKLVITGRNQTRLEETRKSLNGNSHIAISMDLEEISSIEQLIQQAISDGIKFSGFVHFAGIGRILPLNMLTTKRIEETMRVNFYSFIEIIRIITQKKFFSGGSIVGISSFAALEGEKGDTIYSASKAALDAAVRTLAYELAPKNIRINSVRPGMIETELSVGHKKDMGEEAFGKLVRKQLLGLGKPDDVAAMCAFLLSDASTFITGRNFYVDGGRIL